MDPTSPERPGPTPPSRSPRRARSRDTVEIPRSWLALLAAGLAIALLIVAYLVGKESGRRTPETARVDAPAGPARGATEAIPAPPAPPAASAPQPTPWTPAATPPGAGREPVAWPDAEEPPRAADPQAAAVAAYFSEIEALEAQAKYWDNPQGLAMSLVGQGAQGDTSGMQQLLETQRAAQQQIQAMSVPPPCQEHHQKTVEVLGQALGLLEGLEGRLTSGDVEGLLALSGEARQLETATRAVDALASEIKTRYGLPGS